MPEHMVLELDTAGAVDGLDGALRNAAADAERGFGRLTGTESAAEVAREWHASNLLLEHALALVADRGNRLITAVKTMLALD